mgnify:CR=1 FL=1
MKVATIARMKKTELAARIDHTLLAATASPGEVVTLVHEAVSHGFASVCVNPVYVPAVRELLDEIAKDTPHEVKLCAVASFPLGAVTPMQRAIEATQSVKSGAEEIDLVCWLPRIIHLDEPMLRSDLLETTRAVRASRPSCVVKAIIETGALREAADDDAAFEKMIECACSAARGAGCDYVKTSTGFHSAGGATVEAVRLMRKHSDGLKVKASGGVRTYDDAMAMFEAGADRIGASSSVKIVEGAPD